MQKKSAEERGFMKFIGGVERVGNRLPHPFMMFVWLIATITFIYIQMRSSESFWQVFVWAIPCSCLIVQLVNRKYRNSVVQLASTSLFIWSFLAALYLQFIEYNFWLVFIAGIPLQAICIMWFVVKKFK